MKVQFINPFISAAHDVFDQITQKSLSLGPPTLKTGATTSHEVNVIIGVTGNIGGQVIYSMEYPVAMAIAGAMMGKPLISFDEIAQSAIAEMGNILTGQAMIRLANEGYRCSITPPTVIQGKNISVSTLDIMALSVPLYSEVGDIMLDVALKENSR